MTSVLKRYAQIDPRTGFFRTFGTCLGYTLKTNSTSNPVMMDVEFVAAFVPSSISFASDLLLKDLGRQITVYDTTGTGSPHIAIFRQVMQVNGPLEEGISSNIAYICTWADGSGGVYTVAPVARTG